MNTQGTPEEKRDFSTKGGYAFKKKFGKKGFKSMIGKRWDRHFGRICLNCDKTREEIENSKLPCTKTVKKLVMVEEVVSFKEHKFNDPAKGKPKPTRKKK